jgi:chromate reductase, NAD(P)H dehydrogenase (quinone)
VRILAVSGSLRAGSGNTRLVEALPQLADPGVEVSIYRGLGGLPLFNPDLEDPLPEPVAALRRAVGAADGLIICSPEYAHGVAGALKNALDWLVPSVEFAGIRAAIINAAPRARHAVAHLRGTLEVMSAELVDEACIAVSMSGRLEDAAGIVGAPDLAGPLQAALRLVAAAGPRKPREVL